MVKPLKLYLDQRIRQMLPVIIFYPFCSKSKYEYLSPDLQRSQIVIYMCNHKHLFVQRRFEGELLIKIARLSTDANKDEAPVFKWTLSWT